MNDDYLTFEIFKVLLQTFGRDFVTEDLIRDVQKIQKELFPPRASDDVPF
jgi:hypothetical protein